MEQRERPWPRREVMAAVPWVPVVETESYGQIQGIFRMCWSRYREGKRELFGLGKWMHDA